MTSCPCIDCITLAMCKPRYNDLSLLCSYCSLVRDFLLADFKINTITYWLFREQRERLVKEILSGKPHGYNEEFMREK